MLKGSNKGNLYLNTIHESPEKLKLESEFLLHDTSVHQTIQASRSSLGDDVRVKLKKLSPKSSSPNNTSLNDSHNVAIEIVQQQKGPSGEIDKKKEDITSQS